MKFQINGVLPLPEKDANGVTLTSEVYKQLVENLIPVYDLVSRAQGRGTKLKSIQVGTVQGLIRHQTLKFQGYVEGNFAERPYLRLMYRYLGDQIDPSSLGLVFSDQPGALGESNYQLKEVKE